jgi:hypothetical protein
MGSPTQRSLALLRKEGYPAQVVERYNPYARVRIDLFNFIDIVGLSYNTGKIFGIQTTSQSHVSDRIKKILAIPEAKYWLQAGAKIYVHGWAKKGKAKKRKLWQCSITEITLKDFKT